MSDELLWDLNETARQLGSVSTRTVQRLIKRGELRSVQVLRRVKVQCLECSELCRKEHATRA